MRPRWSPDGTELATDNGAIDLRRRRDRRLRRSPKADGSGTRLAVASATTRSGRRTGSGSRSTARSTHPSIRWADRAPFASGSSTRTAPTSDARSIGRRLRYRRRSGRPTGPGSSAPDRRDGDRSEPPASTRCRHGRWQQPIVILPDGGTGRGSRWSRHCRRHRRSRRVAGALRVVTCPSRHPTAGDVRRGCRGHDGLSREPIKGATHHDRHRHRRMRLVTAVIASVLARLRPPTSRSPHRPSAGRSAFFVSPAHAGSPARRPGRGSAPVRVPRSRRVAGQRAERARLVRSARPGPLLSARISRA